MSWDDYLIIADIDTNETTATKGKRKGAVTLGELARLSGVSQPIVSKVLHGGTSSARVSKATAERVRKVAEDAGYRPNIAARAMRSGRFGSLGLLLSTAHHRSILSGALLDALLESTANHGLHLTVAQLPGDTSGDIKPITPLLFSEWLVDGLLINYNTEIPQVLLELLSRGDLPAVWINTKQPADCVYPNDFQGAQMGTQKFVEAGHKSIAFAIYSGWGHYSSHDRYAGYSAAMDAAGLEKRLITMYTSVKEHLDDAKRWLARPDRPSAVLCYADLTLKPILKAASQLNIAVPEQLAVMTFSDEQSYDVDVPIATILLPQREIGQTAVDMLRKRLESPSVHLPPISLPFSMLEGSTVKPPEKKDNKAA